VIIVLANLLTSVPPRAVMPRFGKSWWRCVLTVRWDRNSLFADLLVRQPFGGELGDLQLLRRQRRRPGQVRLIDP